MLQADLEPLSEEQLLAGLGDPAIAKMLGVNVQDDGVNVMGRQKVVQYKKTLITEASC